MRHALAVLVLASTSCVPPTKPPPPPVPEKTSVELYSWWSAPSEAGALDKIFDLFRGQNPNVQIVNSASGKDGTAAQAEMRLRVIANTPPDLFLLNPHDIPSFTSFSADGGADVRNTLTPVDDVVAGVALPADVLDVISSGSGAARAVYGVPLDIHRQNPMFYNKEVFTRLSLTPPQSLGEFFTTCDVIQAANAGLPADQRISPLAISRQGWIVGILLKSVVAASAEEVSPGHGTEYLENLMFGRADPQNDPEFRRAIVNMNKLLSCSNQLVDGAYGWTDATADLKAGRAAMFVHGDWAKGELVVQGATAGSDFDVVAAFGTSSLFLYNLDVFALFSNAAHPVEGRLMLSTMFSVEAQIAFNKVKGSSPVRSDVPLDSFDPVARRTYQDYSNPSTHIVSVERDHTSFWDDVAAALVTTTATDTCFWDKRKAHTYDTTSLDVDVAAVLAVAGPSYLATRAQFGH